MALNAVAGKIGRIAIRGASILFSAYAVLLYCVAFSPGYGPLLGLPAWLIGQWVATLCHEAGHALAALACGWRVIVFAVRPLGIQLVNRNIALVRRNQQVGAGGWVLSVPGRPAVATKGRFAIFIAAGPLTILVVAVIALTGSISWLNRLDSHDYGISLVGLAFGIQALRSCIFSLLPHWRPTGTSDGQSLWRLRSVGEDWAAKRSLLWMAAMLLYRVRLRDIPPWMLAAAHAAALSDDAQRQGMATIDIGVVLDTEPVDAARARRMIDTHRASYGASEWLDSVDAYLTAMWEADGARARATLWAGTQTKEMRPMVMAAEAAVAAREGDLATARSRLGAMRAAVKAKSPFRDTSFRDIGRQIEALLA